MIGTALATPIRVYAQIVRQLARSLNPQMSIEESGNSQSPIFDLPIDPRVEYHEPGYNAVLNAIQENAKRIGNQISQMGHEIKKTGKNISSVGYNLLEFSKKATETLYKTPLIPQSYEDAVPISLEPNPVDELSKLVNSTPKVIVSFDKPAMNSETNVSLALKNATVSSLVDETVAQNKSEKEPIVEVRPTVPLSEISSPVNAPSDHPVETGTDSPFLQSVVTETLVIPELNIVSEEVSSTASSTQPPVPASVVVTTMEMLAPVSTNSLFSAENEVLESSTNLAVLKSNQSALNFSSVQPTETFAQFVPVVTNNKQESKTATETPLLSEMTTFKVETVGRKFNNDVEKVNLLLNDTLNNAQNDKVATVETLVSTVNF